VEGQAAEVEQLIQQVEEELVRAGRPRQGPPIVVVNSPAPGGRASQPGAVSVDVMMPVAPGTLAPAGFEARSLPPQAVAYTVHHGHAQSLASAEAVLFDWVRIKALKLGGQVRRVYLKRGKNPKKDITELQIPLGR
jgi:effector-binding domain-containing protein